MPKTINYRFHAGQRVYLKEQLNKFVAGKMVWRNIDKYEVEARSYGLRTPMYQLKHCRYPATKLWVYEGEITLGGLFDAEG